MSPSDKPVLLSGFSDPNAVNEWVPIEDRVMGGLSYSRLRQGAADHADFEGEVSLARNGGFAAVRSRPGARGKSGADACLMVVRGADKPYKLSLLTEDGFDSLIYPCSFTPAGKDWQRVVLPLAAFRASFRRRDLPAAPALDPARSRQVGLLIAARQAGPFNLDICWIGLR